MTLFAMTHLLAELEPLERLGRVPNSMRIAGLLQAARPAVIAALTEGAHGPALVITAHAQEAHDLAAELEQWSVGRVDYFPALESMPYERVHMDRAVVATRETVAAAVSRGDSDIVVAPIRALMQPINRPDTADNTPLSVGLGARLSIDSVLRSLMERGYAEVDLVEEAGTFARRGGV